MIFVVEGREPGQHFINQNPQRIIIHRPPIPPRQHNLRCQIIRRPTKCPSLIGHFFGKAEIDNFNVSLGGDEDIFGFEVAVDDVLGVEVFEGEDYLSGVELGNEIWEGFYLCGIVRV